VRKMASVNTLLETVLRLVQRDLELRNIEVERHFEEIPETLVNEGMMEEVFLNLVLNAEEAIDHDGKLSIRIALETDAQEEAWIVTSFSDTGRGIPEEDLPHIFDPFFTTRGEHGGTGLGLNLTHNIMRAHGGTIVVESTLGGGTTFNVRLPVRKERRQRQAPIDVERRSGEIARRSSDGEAHLDLSQSGEEEQDV